LNIAVLFLDIGGLILTNGWDRAMRRRAAETFGLDFDEMNERHNLTFDTYERGLLSLEEYLQRVVFHHDRPFTAEQFKSFMFEQSSLWGQGAATRNSALVPVLRLFREVADAQGLRVAAVSNEGRELAVHRIRQFHLADFMDFFIISSFVRFRKPDEDIFRLALDIAQVLPEQAIYIDDRLLFVEVAHGMGIHSIHHEDLEKTCRSLENLGLVLPESCVPR
jgi:putative hydrolase of the HAD superfamily